MKIALVGAECEENLARPYIRAARKARGHKVIQITSNAETDIEAAAECIARSDAGLAGARVTPERKATLKATQSHPKATCMRHQSHPNAC